MNTLHLFFHWPDGGVWSNLIASLVCFILGMAYAHFLLWIHHRKLDAQHHDIQAELALIRDHLKKIRGE